MSFGGEIACKDGRSFLAKEAGAPVECVESITTVPTTSTTTTTLIPGGRVFLEAAGRVVVEAETFSSRMMSLLDDWIVVPAEGMAEPSAFLGSRGAGFIQAQPDGGVIDPASGPNEAPFVDYVLRIGTTGTYRLYVRWASHSDGSDTFYSGVLELADGGGGAADWYRFVRTSDPQDFSAAPTWFGSAGAERTDSPFSNGEAPATWEILAAGDYTLRISMREDGAAIDAFVLQLESMAAPTGMGPAASIILGGP
jgi:hypothetical protein